MSNKQHTNRAAEISEMWRAREKERELDAKQRHESKDNSISMHVRNGYLNEDSRSCLEENSALTTSLNKRHKINSPCGGSQSRHENDLRDSSIYCSSSKRYCEDSYSRGDAGLQDDDIEEFLHSRVKRGRGSVGCRMDEPGPYLPSTSADLDEPISSPAKRVGEERKRGILGPEKPHYLKSISHEGVGCKSKKDHYEEKKKSKMEKSENKRRKEKMSKNQKKHRRSDSGKPKTKYV